MSNISHTPDQVLLFQQRLSRLPTDDLQRLLATLKQKVSLTDFLSFIKDTLNLMVPEHYKEWFSLLKQPRVAIMSARDHGKTTFFSEAYPLWRMVTTPEFKVCIVSYSEPQSRAILRNLRLRMESCPVFQDMIPRKWRPGSWAKTEVHLLNRSYTNAKSFGSSMRGGHYDLVIVDDPLKDRASMPIDQQREVFFGVISPAVKPGGQLIVVGTPVRYGDLFDDLRNNQMYTYKEYPAIKDNGEAMWPDRYSLEALDNRKKELMHYWLFAREYLLKRIDPTTAAFKQDAFKFFDQTPQERMTLLMSVDPAITFEGDATGVVVTGTNKDNVTHVLGTRKMRTPNVQEIINSIMDTAQFYGVKRLIIEAVGFQRLLKFWLYKEMEKRSYWMSVEEVRSHRTSKAQRILTLQPKLEQGLLSFRRQGSDDLIGEMLSFPKGQNDDLVDALSLQVGYWTIPDKEPTSVPEGSFADHVNRLRKTTGGPWEELFRDLGGSVPTGGLVL